MEAKSSEPLTESQRRLADRGAKGVAGRALPRGQGEPSRAHLRLALKKVGGKAQARAADPAAKPRKRGERSAQAALGAMGRPPSSFSDAELNKWLDDLSPDQLKKMGKLVWQAKQRKEGRGPGLDKAEQLLRDRGMRFEIHAQNVTINLPGEQRRGGYYSGKRNYSYSDWGRRLGNGLKGFINGH
jgi:hypothetical protein